MKIVVLAGGLSPERTVSLVTGASVCRALREMGHQAVFMDIFLGFEAIKNINNNILNNPDELFHIPDGLCPAVGISEQEPDLNAIRASRKDQSACLFGPGVLDVCRRADLVFLALHGRDGEDGRVQAAFDLFGIPYTGSGYLASGIAMDKIQTKRVMFSVGIPTPDWKILEYNPHDERDIKYFTENLPMPCVIKNTIGGSSLGVFLPKDRIELKQALIKAVEYGGEIFWEKRIEGRDITVGVLGDQALPAVEILPAEGEFDYSAKYQTGGAREICPAPITEQEQKEAGRLALLLHKSIGLQVYSRTDFKLDKDGKFWCLEINSLPGLTPASLVPKEAAAVGMDYNQLCGEIIRLSLPVQRRGEPCAI